MDIRGSLVRGNAYDRNSGDAPTGKGVQGRYIENKENWLEFCMFPELVTPTRMPSLFPVPTHLCKRQTVGLLRFGAADLAIKGMFRPDVILSTPSAYVGSDFVYRSYTSATTVDDSNDDTAGPNQLGAVAGTGYTAMARLATPSVTQSLAHGGYRLVASTIEFEYIGTLETHSGIIEVGLHIHSRDDEGSAIHLAADSEIVQMPCYRKFKPMDGARMVWFPIDGKDFEFLPMIGTGVNATTASYKTNTAQWCVNMSGLQPNQAVRVHIQSYYEVIPDEADYDIYLPRRTTQSASAAQIKQATSEVANAGAFATPAKSSSMWATGFDAARSYIAKISELYGLYNQAKSDPIGAIGKLFG